MAAHRARIEVNAHALREILIALQGPEHLIRELQFTRNACELTGKTNPINTLMDDFKAWQESKEYNGNG